MTGGPQNTLYYGDNLDILRRYIDDDYVDLIYLDPPFNSNQNYNVLFIEKNGKESQSQIKAFEDTWKWSIEAEEAYEETILQGGKISDTLKAFREFLGENDMMAYLSMMAPRLKELHRVLKPTGSIYLHCDPTASHYLKVMMDAIFGQNNFRNEIIWRRTGSHAPRRGFGPIHDTILFYSKTNEYYFKIIRRPYMKGHVESRYIREPDGRMRFSTGGNILTGSGSTKGESGMPWKGFDPASKNRHWAIPGYLSEQLPPESKNLGVLAKLDILYDMGLIEIKENTVWPTPVKYLSENDGLPISDIWAYQPYTEGTVFGTDDGIDQDVAWLGPTDPERMGYQTQKPEGLLERIILSSCPDGGVVLDPFCGCGTATVVAQKLNRSWIGIDITYLAISLIRNRLHWFFNEQLDYQVIGEPRSLADAKALAEQDPYQFQWWALGLVGARPVPVNQKKGADKGIDGKILFFEHKGARKPQQIIISVKSGTIGPNHIRDLRGVLDREKAAIGVLITLQEPTKPMMTEASKAGFYSFSGIRSENYPKIQILTIKDLFDGKQIKCPPYAFSDGNITNKTAQKYTLLKGRKSIQLKL